MVSGKNIWGRKGKLGSSEEKERKGEERNEENGVADFGVDLGSAYDGAGHAGAGRGGGGGGRPGGGGFRGSAHGGSGPRRSEDPQPWLITDMPVSALPPADQKALKEGISLPEDYPLTKALEDYCS